MPSACGITASAAGVAGTFSLHYGDRLYPQLAALLGGPTPRNPMPLRSLDPTCRLRGWQALAAEVERIRTKLREQGENVVIACDAWSVPGEIAFYLADRPPVYSLGLALGDRHSQYDLWHPNPIDDREAGARHPGQSLVFYH